MRISLNWLRDYLDIKPDVNLLDLTESLTLAGLEVEGIVSLSEKSDKLFLGVVKSIENLSDEVICEVDTQSDVLSLRGKTAAISLGMIVAYVPFAKNEEARLATYADLGLLNCNDVICIDPTHLEGEIPEKLSSIKDFDDVVISLGITPNRADALSHLGVSRELSALLDLNARSPMLMPREMAGPIHGKVTVEIDNAEDCPRYACRLIENVSITESPYWIKLRLLASGIRPINNVVDITNYVMLSRGQPMHAFDYDQLQLENTRAKIVVKRAENGEKFIALDGKEITLSEEDVVISDREKTLALAGVIGGLSSAVSEQTKTVLLESAYFDPKNVRLTARRYGMSTESSYRFERGVDPNGVVDALNYAARLLTEGSDAKACREHIDAYRKRIDPQEIKMRPDRAQAVLGMDAETFDQDLLRKRFLRLGIETVAKRGDAIYFRVPTYRSDLEREIDLIEEAARMIGYDKVKSTSVGPVTDDSVFGNQDLLIATKKLKERLVARGFREAINYAFLQKDFQGHFLEEGDEQFSIELKNPLSDRYGIMRVSLIPGLIKNLLHNQRNQEKAVHLFEIGTVFLGRRDGGDAPNPSTLFGSLDQDSFAKERQMLAGVMSGSTPYFAFDAPLRPVDFYHLKGVVSELLRSLSLHDAYPNASVRYEHGANVPFLHPGESSTISVCISDNEAITVGNLGRLHPQIAARLDVVGDVFIFELDVEKLTKLMAVLPKYQPFSRYPTIERDVAFLVNEDVPVGDILQAVESMPDISETLVHLRVFDVYRGKNIEAGKKSVGISLLLQKNDRTLVDEEADEFVNQVIAKVRKETGAEIR